MLWSILLVLILSPSSDTQQKGEWIEVATFSGSGISETNDFSISATKWRIQYDAKKEIDDESVGMYFSAYIYKGSEDVGTIGNVLEESTAKSYFRTKGEHHIKVNSANCRWSLLIEEYVVRKIK